MKPIWKIFFRWRHKDECGGGNGIDYRTYRHGIYGRFGFRGDGRPVADSVVHYIGSSGICRLDFTVFVYKKVKAEKIKKVTPYIEEKYDEIYEICEKGHALL